MSPAGQRQDSPSHSAIMSTISASLAARLIISGYRRASAAPTGPIADQLHQVAEYVAAGRVLEPEHPVGAIQRVEQAAYPRGGDRQGPPPAAKPQAVAELRFPCGYPLPRRSPQRLSSASSCADPRCSISCDPRRDDHTTCAAVAPDFVFTVRRYGTGSLYGLPLVRKSSSREQQTCR